MDKVERDGKHLSVGRASSVGRCHLASRLWHPRIARLPFSCLPSVVRAFGDSDGRVGVEGQGREFVGGGIVGRS